MKNFKLFSFLMLLAASFVFIQCTSDPIPGPAGTNGQDGTDGTNGIDGVSTGAATSPDELIAQKVLLGPVVDGVIDASWANAPILVNKGTVPDPGNDVFLDYAGNEINFQVRAQYDDEYIYFLAQWQDDFEDSSRDTWYFDPTQLSTNAGWAQESNKPVFVNGVKTREAFYEDKFGMQWNINSSNNWDNNTCYATCHTNDTADQGFAHHYTTVAGEQTDMWHWKSVRTGKPLGQFDDKHIVFPDASHLIKGGKTRVPDAKVSGSHSNNKQTVALLDGTLADVTIPKYFIPGESNYYWILGTEIADNTAKLIKGAYSNGDLEYYTTSDISATGPTAILTPDADFQRDATTVNRTPALKGMPSITTAPIVGSRGDIICGQTYTGNGWILEFKRKLNTGNSDDVVFDVTKDYKFGLGIFDNAAIAHAIKPGLTLKFAQ